MQPGSSQHLNLCTPLGKPFFKAGSVPPAHWKRSHYVVQDHVPNDSWNQESNSGPSDCRTPILTPHISFQGCHGQVPEAGWFKQPKCVDSQPWRPDPRPGVGQLGVLEALRESAPGPSPAPGGWSAGSLWGSWARRLTSCISAFISTCVLSGCMSLCPGLPHPLKHRSHGLRPP